MAIAKTSVHVGLFLVYLCASSFWWDYSDLPPIATITFTLCLSWWLVFIVSFVLTFYLLNGRI